MIAALIALVVITVVLLVVQLASDAAVRTRIDTGYILATIVLSRLLGAFHGGLAVAIAGMRARPSLVLGIGLGVAFAGCVVVSLFPLSDVLAPWRHLRPGTGLLAATRWNGQRTCGATRRSRCRRSS